MFLEESSLGRQHWRQNLPLLLQRLASTLHWVLQGQPTPGSTWGYLVIKVRATLGRGRDQYLQGQAGHQQQCPEGCNASSCLEWPFLGFCCFFRGKEY